MERSHPPSSSTLYALLEKESLARGFVLSGSVDLSDLLSEGSEYARHVERYLRWISNGFQGEMTYLERGSERRADPRLVFPEARSIFCVAMPYDARPVLWSNRKIARYARGRDYHQNLAENLEAAVVAASKTWVATGGASFSWKVCVDTSAVLERSVAALAGLGWIGKNTLLIHPQLGSYLLLAEVMLDVELGRRPSPLPNYCGNCSRCLEACPTQALTEPGTLDSRRCISYQTLEYRGPFQSDEQRTLNQWVAGCDICQEVCPFNSKPSRLWTESDHAPADLPLPDAEQILTMSDEQIKATFKSSALSRIKPAQWRRNILATR